MRLTLPLLLLALVVGCAPPSRDAGPSQPRPSGPQPLSGDEALATVDGVPITAARVEELARATGLGPAEVLDRLVDFELLAAEARRRGFARGRDVRAGARKAAVQRYLAEELEAHHRVEDMPEEMLRKAYEQNRRLFVRPRLRKVAHILIEAPASKASPEDRALARRLAQKVRGMAEGVRDLEGFLELGRSLEGTLPLPVRTEDLSTYVHEYAPLDRSFVAAALKLDRVGEMSPPVDSAFGAHIIFLKTVEEPLNRSFEEVRAEVAEQEHPFWLKAEFAALVERLRLSTKVTGWSGELHRDLDQ